MPSWTERGSRSSGPLVSATKRERKPRHKRIKTLQKELNDT